MAWVIDRRAVLTSALGAAFVANARAAPAMRDADFTRAATAAVERIEREDGFSGVILVARGDQVLLRKAAGFANRERNIPNTAETKFPLESVTKQFTAAAIMLLVQDGKISLANPISKYYAASTSAWNDVTIQHLLTNGSGISDYWVRHPEAQMRNDAGELYHSNDELIRLSLGDPLAFPPGTNIEYSNTGFALLTVVIERVSGQRYGDFLKSRIFEPLGMRNTGYGGTLSINGYIRAGAPDEPKSTGPLKLDELGGFGGIYSTLDDMLIWSLALEGDLILSRTSRTAMFTDYGFNYGFGWRFAPKFGRKLIWHTGNGWNQATIFDRFPDEQLAVVAMSNDATPTGATATLLIEGKVQTFPANAMRKLVEEVERLYFGRAP